MIELQLTANELRDLKALSRKRKNVAWVKQIYKTLKRLPDEDINLLVSHANIYALKNIVDFAVLIEEPVQENLLEKLTTAFIEIKST